MPLTMTEAEAVDDMRRSISRAITTLRDARQRISTLRTPSRDNAIIESCDSILLVGQEDLESLRDTAHHVGRVG